MILFIILVFFWYISLFIIGSIMSNYVDSLSFQFMFIMSGIIIIGGLLLHWMVKSNYKFWHTDLTKNV